MKWNRMMITVLGLLCVVLVKSEVSAKTGSVPKDGILPAVMEPGSVLLFDESCQPMVAAGDYLEADNAAKMVFPCTFSIPAKATEEEQLYFEEESKQVEKAFESWCPDGFFKTQIYPGMKVVYNEDSGEVDNIYYVDETEPFGYSIHNPQEENAAQETAENPLLCHNLDGGAVWTGDAHSFPKNVSVRDGVLKDRDCVSVNAKDYRKGVDNDVVVRNLETGASLVWYEADADWEPEGVIDVWGTQNLQTLAGKKDLESPVFVRYYHKKFH